MTNANAHLRSWLSELKRPLQMGFSAALLTAAVVLFLPDYYRSEVRILPVSASGTGNLAQLAAAAAAFGVTVPGQDGGEASYVDILNSRWLREKLLATEYVFHLKSWRFGSENPRKETLYAHLEPRNLDRAVKTLGEMITVSRDLKTKLVTVSVETRSPELSQQVARNAAKLLETFVQEKGRTRGGFKAAFAEARLKEARQEMAQAEDDFRRFLSGNRNYLASADPTVRLQGSRLESELQLRRQLVTTLAMNREQALMEEKNDIPILNVLDDGNLPIEKSRPGRSGMVAGVFLFAGLLAWVWGQRHWILRRLEAENPPVGMG